MSFSETSTSGYTTRFVHSVLHRAEIEMGYYHRISDNVDHLKTSLDFLILELAFIPDELLRVWLQGRPRLTRAVSFRKAELYTNQGNKVLLDPLPGEDEKPPLE